MKKLSEIKVGDTFKVAGIEFIKFSENDGKCVAVDKDLLFIDTFGENNNFATSTLKERLEKEVLRKIEQEVGAENIVEHEVDLLSLDGDDKWGRVTCKISLPTFDFYRANVKIFDKYNPEKWWWLLTPYSTDKHYNNSWVSCVSPSGRLSSHGSDVSDGGVRPFIIFVSSISVISVSCEG